MQDQKDVPTSQPANFGDHARGAPDAPEEANPRGHDSFNPPETPQQSAAAPPPLPPEAPTPPKMPPGSGAVTDAQFLVDEFRISEPRAASLVAQGRGARRESEKIENGLRQVPQEGDPLASVPTPDEPANDLVKDNDEQRLKPVLHTPNNRVGGG